MGSIPDYESAIQIISEQDERIAALTEQLHKCAVAARSYEEAVAIGEPFGDEVKAVLTLRQNADAGFAELAQARAEIEQMRGELEQPWKHSEHWRNPETGQVECECCCSWALDTEKLVKELDSLRAQLEQMSRPVTHEESFHFEDDEVLRNVEGTDFIESRLALKLHLSTSGEKWSLYRAIAKLVIAARRARLLQPKTVEERVTISHQEGGKCFVCVDGEALVELLNSQYWIGDAVKDGLIAKLKEEGTVSREDGADAQ